MDIFNNHVVGCEAEQRGTKECLVEEGYGFMERAMAEHVPSPSCKRHATRSILLRAQFLSRICGASDPMASCKRHLARACCRKH
jgi:hypothetical protein